MARNGISKLGSELAPLARLQSLNLDGNDLTSLPREFGMQHRMLVELRLADNMLAVVPASLGMAVRLRTLNLSGNQLEKIAASALGPLTQLQQLDLTRNERLSEPAPEIVQLGTAAVLESLNQQYRLAFL